ncbi:response regulator transcription factor [Pedobacter punctiformis]|uniref:Response regulator transcription factor n=1 Tax=Pedobacter punctiformis TaxID=3004097 RepID=A0ABT4LBH2_9SPHI|nr:response regulator transcription factor [Pedobacter sp. HCMS5-2]MCZ4244154.1 response regulator transcription factor [Pedobacter sp. HCMS5-2]
MISISIIEDNNFYRELLVRVLKEKHFLKIYGVYSSAEEAIQELPANAPDIAIVDIKLKLKSGIELIETVKPYLANTQFLMCSGFQNDENIFNALKAGASGYIMKGSTEEEIQNAIIELHNGGSPMSPYIARKVINLLHRKKTSDNNLGLSSRELEVLSLLSRGLLYKEISDQLNISANTVKNHCKNIYKRLHVQNKIEAINKFSNYNLQAYAS